MGKGNSEECVRTREQAAWGLRKLHRTPDPAVDVKSRRMERLEHGIQMDQIKLKKKTKLRGF
jgi:hypothetical protein